MGQRLFHLRGRGAYLFTRRADRGAEPGEGPVDAFQDLLLPHALGQRVDRRLFELVRLVHHQVRV